MAANDHLLTLAEAKSELRMDSSDSSADGMLQGHIDAAVSWVETTIDRPLSLTQVASYVQLPPGGSEAPLGVYARNFASFTSIRYWPPGAELREEATGLIEPADIGRIARTGDYIYIYPPADGWPASQSGVMSVLAYNAGADELEAGELAIKQAIILMTRKFYDGDPDVHENDAVYALLRPFRSYARSP